MPDLVAQALDLVLYGMGSVFVFLTVLVAVTTFMSYVLGLTGNNLAEEASLPAEIVDPNILVAISAAVKRYRDDAR